MTESQELVQARVDHMNAFVAAFVIPTKRERYSSQMSGARNRRLLLDRLNHALKADLVESCCFESPPGAVKRIPAAHPVYVIADECECDDQFLDFKTARSLVESSFFGIVLSIKPGELALYKPESPSPVIWLAKNAAGHISR